MKKYYIDKNNEITINVVVNDNSIILTSSFNFEF